MKLGARRRTRTRPHLRIGAVASLVWLTVLSAPCYELAGQSASSLSGRILSGADERPLVGALVSIVGEEARTLTSRTGDFDLRALPPGEYVIEVSYIGHQTLQQAISVDGEERQRIEIHLPVQAVLLRGVQVDGQSALSVAMAGFLERRERGTGFYFTADQIGAMQVRSVTDVLRRVPGANIQSVPGPYGRSEVVQMGRTTGAAGARACSAAYYLNGMPFPVAAEVGIDAYVEIRDVEALEVYSGASRIPSQFGSGQMNVRCGVIVIWTRNGPNQ